MLIILVSAFFCVLNIVLWFFFLLKFKRIFSTDDIVESTRAELNNMLADVNRNMGRNLDLVDGSLKELRAVVAEADRHIKLARTELERQQATAIYQEKLEKVAGSHSAHESRLSPEQAAAKRYLGRKSARQDIDSALQSEMSYSPTHEGNRQTRQGQRDLFSQAEESSDGILQNAETTFTVENDGSSFASIPVIDPSVSYADVPIKPKKRFNELVKELYDKGYSIEDIARELDSSTTEVQFSIDMDG